MTYGKNNPFLATLIESRLLTPSPSTKETRHFEIDLTGSGLTYTSGDSLAIYPENDPTSVQAIIKRLGAKGSELVQLPRQTDPLPFEQALLQHCSLASPNVKSLNAFLAATQDAKEQSKLDQLLLAENKATCQQFLVEREYIDLLNAFPKVQFTPQGFVDLLRRLTPRLYSIASSPVCYPEAVHLTVAVVRYTTNNCQRIGVASTYLADRLPLNQPAARIFITPSHFGLPEDSDTDIIMVGPGTGIAPFRAFVQERSEQQAKGRSWLFFGERNKTTDFLYKEEWEGYLKSGALHQLDLAWSRDQKKRCYVQDRLLAEAARVWDWLENGAVFYVCGDAKNMAKDVDRTLHRIVCEQGKRSAEDAESYVKQMKKDKRYQRDVY